MKRLGLRFDLILALKIGLVFYPFISLLPFIAIFIVWGCSYFKLASGWFDKLAIKDIQKPGRFTLKILLGSMLLGFIYLIGEQARIQEVRQLVQSFAGFTMLLTYLFMVYWLFWKLGKEQ